MKLATMLSALLLLIAARPAMAVDEGVPDGARHPNVGLLGFDVDARLARVAAARSLCSGSVLSDRLFLTACLLTACRRCPRTWSGWSRCSPAAPATPVVRPVCSQPISRSR